MLKTVEEIEDEISKVLIAHDDELDEMHKRIEIIVERGRVMLEDYERELNNYYAESAEGTYEEEYLASYRQGKKNILESVQNLLQKEAEEMLEKIKIEG